MPRRKITDANSLREAAEHYIQFVVPDAAGRLQVQQTRQAFYAGAGVMHHFLLGKARELPEDELRAFLVRVADEIVDFGGNPT